MKILLLGSNGQLGYEATRTLFCYGDLVAVDYPEIDFTKPDQVIKFVQEANPDLIYNAVAYTDVDKAELEPEKAMLINCHTPGEVANYCKKNKVPFIHFSTDYVFDGQKNDLYTEEDIPNPINVYGISKFAGEQIIIESQCPHVICRTSWVYSMRAGGFVKKVISWAQNNEELRIVDDQIGNPTWARMLAILSAKFIQSSKIETLNFLEKNLGICHVAGGGHTSRYEWTKSIIKHIPEDIPIKVKGINPAKSGEFPTPATRPMFSALNCDKFERIFNLKIPNWEISLKFMLEKTT
ncbi:MAG: dTDP-4-dehydrorhamnose reductase [Chloroflexi bacterium HGW-Chloroflexi-3]|nr:MAG: dTDP-4-dehydrorhamnose reductase [Chloroflexi bacterium HGW-Chloroflexi-3]